MGVVQTPFLEQQPHGHGRHYRKTREIKISPFFLLYLSVATVFFSQLSYSWCVGQSVEGTNLSACCSTHIQLLGLFITGPHKNFQKEKIDVMRIFFPIFWGIFILVLVFLKVLLWFLCFKQCLILIFFFLISVTININVINRMLTLKNKVAKS